MLLDMEDRKEEEEGSKEGASACDEEEWELTASKKEKRETDNERERG